MVCQLLDQCVYLAIVVCQLLDQCVVVCQLPGQCVWWCVSYLVNVCNVSPTWSECVQYLSPAAQLNLKGMDGGSVPSVEVTLNVDCCILKWFCFLLCMLKVMPISLTVCLNLIM